MKTIKFGKNVLIYTPLCFLIFIYPAPYFLLFAIGIRQNHISIKPFPAFLFSSHSQNHCQENPHPLPEKRVEKVLKNVFMKRLNASKNFLRSLLPA